MEVKEHLAEIPYKGMTIYLQDNGHYYVPDGPDGFGNYYEEKLNDVKAWIDKKLVGKARREKDAAFKRVEAYFRDGNRFHEVVVTSKKESPYNEYWISYKNEKRRQLVSIGQLYPKDEGVRMVIDRINERLRIAKTLHAENEADLRALTPARLKPAALKDLED